MNFFLQIKTNFIYCNSYSLLLKPQTHRLKTFLHKIKYAQKHLLTLHIRNLLHNLQYSLIQAQAECELLCSRHVEGVLLILLEIQE